MDFPAQALRVTASYTSGKLGTPKSGLGRVVPLIDEVAQALARLGDRERWTGPDDLVFAGQTGQYLDDSALRRRCKRARDTVQVVEGCRVFGFGELFRGVLLACLGWLMGFTLDKPGVWRYVLVCS